MIDWYNLIMNLCWILGCGIALAALSYASWEASTREEKLLLCMRRSHIQIILNLGGLLFCTGMTGTADVVWQQILWIVLAIGFLIQILIEYLHRTH